jgi:hypothetical protein
MKHDRILEWNNCKINRQAVSVRFGSVISCVYGSEYGVNVYRGFMGPFCNEIQYLYVNLFILAYIKVTVCL